MPAATLDRPRPGPPAVEPLSLRPRDAAALLGISERHLWELSMPRGPIPCVKLGRRLVYRLADLRAYLESVVKRPTPADWNAWAERETSKLAEKVAATAGAAAE